MQALQDYQQRLTELVSNDHDLPERKPIESLEDFDPVCMKEGYLQKKGQRLKGWKRRWFVCDARTLSYYINRKDRKPNAVIPLEGCTVQDGGLSETWNSPRIYLTDGTNGVMYCLSAEDGDAVTQWLSVLRHAVARVNGSDVSTEQHTSAPASGSSSRGATTGAVVRSDRGGANVRGGSGASDEDDARTKQRTAPLKSASVPISSSSDSATRRASRLASGASQTHAAAASASAANGANAAHVRHGHGKVKHLPTNIALENELSHGLDVLESLLCSKTTSRHGANVAFRPLGAANGVLRSVGTDAVSGAVYARASVVLPVSSEVAGYLLADHARRREWDLHFPHSTHIASFDDATDLVHLSGGFQQLQATQPFVTPQVAAGALAAIAALGSAALASVAPSWDALLTTMLYAGVVGGVVNSVNYAALCAPRDVLLLRHVRESSVPETHHSKRNVSSSATDSDSDGDECGQSIVLMLEKSVANELKFPIAGVVRAHVGVSGWLLEPVDGRRTLATYVTNMDVGGFVSAATKRAFLLERLDCVAVLLAFVSQSQLCGLGTALGFDGDESDDENDLRPHNSSSNVLAGGTSASGRRTSAHNSSGAFHSASSSGAVSAATASAQASSSTEFHPKSYMRSMGRTPTGGLKLMDKEVAKKQGGVLKEVIKSAGAKILEGKSAVSLSLPVRIFEPRTNLERVVDMFLFGPTFLTVAATQTDAVERLKFVVAFTIAGLHHAVGQLKPFNPILGETYEATLNDDTAVCCEHTSHHPPISNFQLVNSQYAIDGHVLWHGSFSMKSNALIQIQKGPIRVTLPAMEGDKQQPTVITYTMPHIQLGGFMWGDRTFDIMGSIVFDDPLHHLQCEIKFNPDEKKGMGGMFSTAKTPSDSFRGVIVDTTTNNEVCDVSGSWLDELKFGDRAYWTMDREPSGFLLPIEGCERTTASHHEAATTDGRKQQQPLESDSRNREDRKALALGDLDDAQEWKVKLEVLQRADRKVRNDGRRPNHWSFQDENKAGGGH